MSDSYSLTIRFRKNNIDEMEAYDFISKESKTKNISKNQIMVQALLKASADNSSNNLIEDIVEGISKKLLEKGVVFGDVSPNVDIAIEFMDEDFSFMG